MRSVVYPGTFDPITNGHTDLICRAARLCDRVVVAVAEDTHKQPAFDIHERVALAREVVGERPKVEVISFRGLLVELARRLGVSVIVRGLRAVADFEYEYQMVGMNRKLDPEIETVFLMADAQHQAIASKLVKEIARLGGDITHFVSPAVKQALGRKFR